MSERFVNSTIKGLAPSGIRRFFNMAGQVKGAISLGVGEPDFSTPYPVRAAMVESLLSGETQYTENAGLLALREEIALYEAGVHGHMARAKDEIIVTVGASEGIDLCLRAVLDPGDGVLIPDPAYVSYAPCVTMQGGVAVPVPLSVENSFQLTAEALEKAYTPNCRVLILCYPNNPTGAVLDRQNLSGIVRFAERHDLLIISDEIYRALCYDKGEALSALSVPGAAERTVLLNGFSKSFAMTGLRLGYVIAPAALCSAMLKIHQYTMLCAPRPSQVAALHALQAGRQNGYAEVARMRDSYNRRRRLMYKAFCDMGLECFEPMGAFYMFPSIKKTGLTSEAFCMRLLEEEKVVAIPGTAFGERGEGYIRCCYATDINKLKEAFERMARFLQNVGGDR